MLNDRRHGKGLYIYSNGMLWDGDWVNGKRHGLGYTYWSSGNCQQFIYKDGLILVNNKGKKYLMSKKMKWDQVPYNDQSTFLK